jgi:hypothetical protein
MPKKVGAVELKDFRPISLVHSFTRLLTKVMARRLAPRMDELVGKNQTAFIQGRCIQDNFLLVRESAKLLHRKKIPALLLKIDIAKAFDSIAWPFLLSILRHRGFGPRWIRLIALLLRSASTTILVNGSAGSAFRHGRGLRQGDPISPMLFVIAMDVLSAMFLAAERAGVLSDLSALGLRHRVSLYADDVVVFARPAVAELDAVWAVLRCFGCASGLVANPAKSSAAPIRCSDDQSISASLPCAVIPLPATYLGLPLSTRKPRKAELHAVIDRLAAKLPFWKARLLSREGRLVYVQAVLTGSVIYQLMALDLDPWFFKAVDKLRGGFLWAGSADTRGGSCLVAWRLVCQPKSLGGLGLHNLRYMNLALRTRWLWLQKTDGTKPWAGLELPVAAESIALFNASVRIIVGSGETVLFWEDAWIDDLTVQAIAPALVDLVRPSVRRRRTVREGRQLNAWATDIAGELSVDTVVQYLRIWEAVQRVPNPADNGAADSFVWKWTGDGSFSARSAYRLLFQGSIGLPAAPLIWESFAPLKYRLHAWLALRRRCWTADRRLRRGLPSHTLCALCSTANETLDHLLLHCVFSRAIWVGLIATLRLPNFLPDDAEGIND